MYVVPLKLKMAIERTAQFGALIVKPLPATELLPSSVITGVPEKPGWVLPSIVTVSVIAGKTAMILRGPVPGILNAIVSTPGFALASRIACASEPGPVPLVLVTVNVVPAAETRGEILQVIRASSMRITAMIRPAWTRRTLLSMTHSLSPLMMEEDSGN